MFWKEDVGVISRITHTEEEKFMWMLPNCFSYREYDDTCESRQCVLTSPVFSFYCRNWRLVLMRHHFRNKNECVGLFLWEISSHDCLDNVTIELGMETQKRNNYFKGKLNLHGCFGKWNFEQSHCFSDSESLYSHDGFLKVFCKFQSKNIYESPQECKNEEEKPEVKDEDNKIEEIPEFKGVDKLVQDLKSLLLNSQNSDVTLKVQDREFKAHRNILIARSPVFSSMLQHDTKENTTGVVDIPDCSVDAFEVFLSYVYTGKLDIVSSNNVFDLYYAADKYQVIDLKFECVEYMKENLTVANFCSVMTLSLQHSESCLQKKATEFFCFNVKQILKTVQWQEYVKNYPVQANELYIKAVNA